MSPETQNLREGFLQGGTGIPPGFLDRFTIREKLALGAEVAVTYCRVRLRTAGKGLPAAVAAIRDIDEENDSSGWEDDTYVRAMRLGTAVQKTLRVLPGDSRCLMQSLVLTAVLTRRRIPSTLLIGVESGDEFRAHAWVEYRGRPVLPGSQGVYMPLTRI
jgi:hypothetical protein